jgi:hypothetical protein
LFLESADGETGQAKTDMANRVTQDDENTGKAFSHRRDAETRSFSDGARESEAFFVK